METTSSAAPRPALQRSRDDAILLGVCGGLGRSLGVASIWPRLGAIALGALVPAVALIAYALLSVVVRRDDGRIALGGAPEDSRESTLGWVVVLLAGYVALTTGSALSLGASSPVLLLAAAAAAGVVAHTVGRGTPPPAQPSDAPTAAMDTSPAGPSRGAGDTLQLAAPTRPDDDTAVLAPVGDVPGPTTTAARPGPSLLLVGVGVLLAVSVGTALVNPVAWFALGPGQAVESGAGVLGLLAVAGVVAAIVFSGRRHAGGLLALSLLVGVMAVGLASVADDAGRLDRSEPVVEWTIRRGADLLRLDP